MKKARLLIPSSIFVLALVYTSTVYATSPADPPAVETVRAAICERNSAKIIAAITKAFASYDVSGFGEDLAATGDLKLFRSIVSRFPQIITIPALYTAMTADQSHLPLVKYLDQEIQKRKLWNSWLSQLSKDRVLCVSASAGRPEQISYFMKRYPELKTSKQMSGAAQCAIESFRCDTLRYLMSAGARIAVDPEKMGIWERNYSTNPSDFYNHNPECPWQEVKEIFEKRQNFPTAKEYTGRSAGFWKAVAKELSEGSIKKLLQAIPKEKMPVKFGADPAYEKKWALQYKVEAVAGDLLLCNKNIELLKQVRKERPFVITPDALERALFSAQQINYIKELNHICAHNDVSLDLVKYFSDEFFEPVTVPHTQRKKLGPETYAYGAVRANRPDILEYLEERFPSIFFDYEKGYYAWAATVARNCDLIDYFKKRGGFHWGQPGSLEVWDHYFQKQISLDANGNCSWSEAKTKFQSMVKKRAD